MQTKQRNMNRGAVLLFVIFSMLFFLLIGRIAYIQITGKAGGEVLAAQAEVKYLKQRVLEANRGSILDTNGEVIAEDTSSYTLFAVLDKKMKPNYVMDPEMTAKKLAKYIDMDEDEIYNRLTKDKVQVEFGSAGRDISHQVKREIEKMDLPGISFIRDTKRFYPNGVFASHLIGYVEKNYNEETKQTDTVGKLGIERFENSELKETDGYMKFDSDAWGLLLPNSKEQVQPPKNGHSVKLTIDKKIQTFMEDSMNKVQEEYKPKQIVAIVANPKTGEILAMGQRPSFHPKTRDGLESTWMNLAIEDNYEPGSTMKSFTLAAAVEEGKFNPNATYVTGTYKVPGGRSPSDHSGIPRGKRITFLEGLQRSSNVAFATLAMEQIGAEKFEEYLKKFGFDKPTGIDLPNEVGGKIVYKYKVEKVNTAFGQGTAVTPIQQVQAATALASDGQMKRPYVIKEITDPATGKTIRKTEPKIAGQPISAETAKKVREYLGTVITAEHGTGKKYKLKGYEVAGKTGTAEIVGSDGKYIKGSKENYMFSFLGMAPKENPTLVMYVAVKQPKLGATKVGADPLSEIFNPVMQNSLQYLNIKPANLNERDSVNIDDMTGKPAAKAVKLLSDKGYKPVVLGKGNTISDQSPKAGSVLLEGERIILRTTGELTAPDMKGWSLRDVMKVASLAQLDLNTSGSGYVTKQNLKPGSIIKEGEYCIVELQSPKAIQELNNKKESSKKTEVHD
ncbi:penicillin-binding protein [Peribacillus saganii]|uniref:serine-type D-Ala-D-Ala carboxypeptidase n=1 Tax=Peribacillus saganii TaxID=2303992 RepID=A0A372LTP1_9BACI|nr:penicillin-binding protein [Peribacillus saganii]RFU71172.1 penicillin-binding protein [Peribacillus saganii]